MRAYCKCSQPVEPVDICEEQNNVAAKDKGLYHLTTMLRKRINSGQITHDNIWSFIPRTIQFRIRRCPRLSFKCCGYCTKQCSHRCLQDIYTRIQMVVYTFEGSEDFDKTLVDSAKWLLEPENHATYSQLISFVSIILKNNSIKYKMGMQGKAIMGYAVTPKIRFDSVTDRPQALINEFTGDVVYSRYPDTGLCPYCMAMVTTANGYIQE